MSGPIANEDAIHGRVDADGRLVSADVPLAALNAQAGGTEGSSIAVPQLAALVRLSRELGIMVSRTVIAADGGVDIELRARAEPDGDDVRLTLTGWTEREAPHPSGKDSGDREQDFQRIAADWQWETDHALRLTSISPEAEESLGDSSRFIGQPLTGLFRIIESEDGGLPILSALAEHRRFEHQLARLRIEGAPEILLTGIPLLDGNGRFTGFRGAAVSHAAPADEPLLLTPEQQIPDAFGAKLDQALRAPLDHIIVNARSMKAQQEGPLRRDYTEYAGDIAKAGEHLLALIDDLVDLEAVERDDFVPEAETLDLAELARNAASLLAARAEDKHIAVDRPAEGERLAAKGDYKRALQILVNLVGNAIRFAPEDSQVWIRCQAEGDWAAVIVADQGRGIEAADQDKIFEKFERLEANEPGTGLGLYISRRLARAMGGDILVESAPGEGARFILTLPRSR